MSNPRISLIVPAYNEEKYLPRLLDSVEAARARYPGPPEAIEVVVADNASTDRTAAIAEARGCRLARVEKRTIAAARNGGARIARGSILAFVDADMAIHPETFNGIEETLATGRAVAGSTGARLERWSIGIAVTYALLVPFVWITGMDTGVVFFRREDFDAVGGYDERLHFAEDVKILMALRRRGGKDGRRLVRARAYKAIASMRKFDQFGDWHYFPLLARGLAAYLGKDRGRAFSDRYWYNPPR